VIQAADENAFERFVLVGHSLGGLTLLRVAHRVPARVAHLVFVSALVPGDGETAFDALPSEVVAKLGAGLNDEVAADLFCSDMDETQTRFVLDRYGVDAPSVMTETVTTAGMPALATTYVRLVNDRALPPAAQDASIERLRAIGPVDVVALDTGHDVMISHPALFASVIDGVAAAT
jgi:pimeloyl-ACP methyl ester carboxylesterase